MTTNNKKELNRWINLLFIRQEKIEGDRNETDKKS